MLMAKAGYNPKYANEFWQRIRDIEGTQRHRSFFATHVTPATRFSNLAELLPEAQKLYATSPKREPDRMVERVKLDIPVTEDFPEYEEEEQMWEILWNRLSKEQGEEQAVWSGVKKQEEIVRQQTYDSEVERRIKRMQSRQ